MPLNLGLYPSGLWGQDIGMAYSNCNINFKENSINVPLYEHHASADAKQDSQRHKAHQKSS